MFDTALATRTALPDAVRVLVAEYPREGWDADPGFDGLIRFWLDRHLMFRKIVAMLSDEAEGFLDGAGDPQRYAARLARLGATFVEQLHGHHTIEDTQYFPKLITLDTRIAAGFDILDKDHHAIDAHLNGFVAAANDVLNKRDAVMQMHAKVGKFHTELGTLAGLLNRHLIDEEELVVPVILKHGFSGMG
jgi:iron-sulfur cluster repair protein YtfE (RIC family)